jgi:long-chain acyl-CoA synthetase
MACQYGGTVPSTLVELFDNAVSRHPDSVAFRRKKPGDVHTSSHHTSSDHASSHHASSHHASSHHASSHGLWKYAEVLEYVRRFSGALLDLGVARGERVVILSDNRPEWGVAFFSIVSVGAVAVPLDRMQSRPEILRLLADSGARFVVAPAAFSRALLEILDDVPSIQHVLSMEEPRGQGRLIGHEELQERGLKSGRSYKDVEVKPEDLVAIAYTSGTTEAPRGVRITHDNLVREIAALEAVDPHAPDDCLISLMPMNHLHELVGGFLRPFFAGGTIGYIHELAPQGILEVMQEFAVTRIVGLPMLFTLLADELSERVARLSGVAQAVFWKSLDMARSVRLITGRSPGKLMFRDIHAAFGGRLRRAAVMGASLPQDLVDRMLDAGLPLDLGYALTEATSVATFGRAGTIPPRSVGRALAGVEIALRDTGPEGVGEVLLRGPTIARGYEGDPKLTDEAFRDGWFHTGDLGYLDPDGNLFLKGRRREAIVNREGRVLFPEELERGYAGVRFVKELCVVGRTARAGRGQEPVAVVVADREDEEAPRTPRALEKAVREVFDARTKELPAHEQVKGLVLFSEALPKTTSMKVRRVQLARMLDQREGATPGMERRRKMRPTVAVMGTRDLDLVTLSKLLESDEVSGGRSMHELAKLLESSTVVLSVWAAGELIGFARALSDGAFHAAVGEVVVAPEWRRKGVGSLLVTRLLEHPQLRHVDRVISTASGPPEFWEKAGFERVQGLYVKG